MRRTLCAAFAAIALMLTLAPAAQAGSGPTWTVTPGGGFTIWRIREDLATHIGPVVCEHYFPRIRGWLRHGSGLRGPLGHIFSAGGRGLGCGIWTLTFTGFPWQIVPQRYYPAHNVTDGEITGISATLSGLGCSATLGGPDGAPTGWAGFSWANGGSFRLLPTGDLTFQDVTGCNGVLGDGTSGAIQAWFNFITVKNPGPPPYVSEDITSP